MLVELHVLGDDDGNGCRPDLVHVAG
jgi:hypothetical protein